MPKGGAKDLDIQTKACVDTYFDGDVEKYWSFQEVGWAELLEARRRPNYHLTLTAMRERWPWFNPDDSVGGTDEHGAPYGLHQFYDYGIVPAWYSWALVRRKILHPIRRRHVFYYWFELAHHHKMAPGGELALADRRAFEEDRG